MNPNDVKCTQAQSLTYSGPESPSVHFEKTELVLDFANIAGQTIGTSLSTSSATWPFGIKVIERFLVRMAERKRH